MDGFFQGYVFSETEVRIILKCIGVDVTKGLPINEKKISAEEEMRSISKLIRKQILGWSKANGYYLNYPFDMAFDAIKKSQKSITFLSKNYPNQVYICFGSEPIIVWEISKYYDCIMTLLIMDANNFIQMILKDEFIPKVSEYSDDIQKGINENIVKNIKNISESGEFVGLNYDFIVKISYEDADKEKHIVVSHDSCGRYISFIKDSNCESSKYTQQLLIDIIIKELSESE